MDDEVGDDASVVRKHARSVGVKDADDADVDAVFAVIIEEEGFCAAFTFVVTGTEADGIHIAPVGFGLGVYSGVAVNLGGGRLEDASFDAFCEAETVHGSDYGGLQGLDGVELVVRGRRRAREVIDAVHLELERIDDVVTDQFKSRVSQEMLNVCLSTGEEVVQANHVVSLLDETFAKV